MSVATYIGADASCFGARDVTLTGWEDRPEGIGGVDFGIEPAWLGTGSPPWSFLVDRLGDDCRQGCGSLPVHVDPASGLRFELDGRWVVITGHRNDPRAQGCALTGPRESGMPSDAEIREGCRKAFVLTAFQDAEPPVAALPTCPTGTVLRVAEYLAADLACFQDRETTLVGWVASLPPHGHMPPPVEPTWLWALTTVGLWTDRQPAPSDGSCDDTGVISCRVLEVRADPASPVKFDGFQGQWVRVTGHREDPAADSCHFVGDGVGDPLPDDLFARWNCREQFVLTSVVKSAPPPSSAP